MQVQIINLERSTERRDEMQRQMAGIGLGYRFFPAVDAKAGAHLAFPQYSAEQCLRSWRRPLSPGEIGCFASHYLLWQRCVAANEPIIVVEDDVEISPEIREAAQLLPSLETVGFVRLSGISTRSRSVPLASDLPPGWNLVRFLVGPMGTQCYAIFPHAARRLLAGADKWVMPVDIYLDAFWQHGVSSVGLLPYVARQTAVSSEIREMGGFPDPIWKPRRVAIRLMDNVRRTAWNAFAALRQH